MAITRPVNALPVRPAISETTGNRATFEETESQELTLNIPDRIIQVRGSSGMSNMTLDYGWSAGRLDYYDAEVSAGRTVIVLGSDDHWYRNNTVAEISSATEGATTTVDYSKDPSTLAGTLQSDWVLLSTPVYESHAAMLAADIPVGRYVRTQYHTEERSKGGADYQIVDTDPADGHSSASANGWAVIQNKGYVSVNMFGAVNQSPAEHTADPIDSLPAFNKAQEYVERGSIYIEQDSTRLSHTSYFLSGRWVVQHRRNFRGAGPAQMQVACSPSLWTTDTVLCQVGEDSLQTCLDTAVYGLTISTNGQADVIAGYSNCLNERSGFIDTRLIATDARSLLIDNANNGGGIGSAKNFTLQGVDLFRSGVGDKTIPIGEILNVGPVNINDMTVSGTFDGTDYPDVGLHIDGDGDLDLVLNRVHCEAAGIGIDVENCNICVGSNINGHGSIVDSVATLMQIDSGDYVLTGLDQRAGTGNLLVDVKTGKTITESKVASYIGSSDRGGNRGPVLSTLDGAEFADVLPATRARNAIIREPITPGANTTTNIDRNIYVFRGGASFVNLHDCGLLPEDHDCQEIFLINSDSSNITVRSNLSTPNEIRDTDGTVAATLTLGPMETMALIGVRDDEFGTANTNAQTVGTWYRVS